MDIPGGAGNRAATQYREHEYLVRLGERVRKKRAARNFSRRQLSELSGVSERFIAHLELGQGNISILRLKAIADALDVPLVRIVDDGGDPAGMSVGGGRPTLDELFKRADPQFQKAVMELLTSSPRRSRAA